MKKREAPKKIFPLGSLLAMKNYSESDSYIIGMLKGHEIDSHLHHWYLVEWYGIGEDKWEEKLSPNEILVHRRQYTKMRKTLAI
jgi:hypothetical protein